MIQLQNVTFKCVPGASAAEQINAFYVAQAGRAPARASDLFFIACESEQILGSVRYCVENEVSMLRIMMMHEKFRRFGLGTDLLQRFVSYLEENEIRDVYCLPYGHLTSFYAAAGFRLVSEKAAPLFLQTRLSEYRQKPAKFILMMRP